MAIKRKTIAEKRAELLAQQKALEEDKREKEKKLKAQIAALDARERTDARKLDTHLKVIMGAAVQAHARIAPSFVAQLRAVLDAAVTKERDRQLIKDWFEQLRQEHEAALPQAKASTPTASALAA